MKIEMPSKQEIEDLETRLSAISPQNLVAIAEFMRKKCYSNCPDVKAEQRLPGLPNIDNGSHSLRKYAHELNIYLGRALVGVRVCETYFNGRIENEMSIQLNVRNAIILQDKEARERMQSFWARATNFVTDGQYGKKQSEWLFSRLGTPELLADLQKYNWNIANMRYNPVHLELEAKVRKNVLDLDSKNFIEDVIY